MKMKNSGDRSLQLARYPIHNSLMISETDFNLLLIQQIPFSSINFLDPCQFLSEIKKIIRNISHFRKLQHYQFSLIFPFKITLALFCHEDIFVKTVTVRLQKLLYNLQFEAFFKRAGFFATLASSSEIWAFCNKQKNLIFDLK